MPEPAAPKRPWGFLLAVIVVAVVISIVIGYLGITGTLGGPIPGTHLP